MTWLAVVVFLMSSGETQIFFAPHKFASMEDCLEYLTTDFNKKEVADAVERIGARGKLTHNLCMEFKEEKGAV